MDDNQHISKPGQTRNPTELLYDQTQSLSELVVIQKSQKEQIDELQHQNERVIGLLADLVRDAPDSGMTHVKIENINMPFGALIGFLVKVSLASIPAFLILLLIYALILFGLSLLGFTLGGLF